MSHHRYASSVAETNSGISRITQHAART